MENRAHRRLALFSSHLKPHGDTSLQVPSCLSPSACASADNGVSENDCVFCKIIHGQASAMKIYEDDECLCILDIFPLCHGDFFSYEDWHLKFLDNVISTVSGMRHTLIIPKRHYPSLDSTPPSIIAAMCSKVPLISNAVMKATGCDSFNLLVNNGAAAGQVISHTHIHIIPRHAQDCLWTSESIRRRPLKQDQDASQLVDSIRESLMFVNSHVDGKGQGSSLVAN